MHNLHGSLVISIQAHHVEIRGLASNNHEMGGEEGHFVGSFWLQKIVLPSPIGSMYDIFAYIWLIFMVNVGEYAIHGSYGSSKLTWQWKYTFSIGNTSSNGGFSIAMLVYRRVVMNDISLKNDGLTDSKTHPKNDWNPVFVGDLYRWFSFSKGPFRGSGR